MGGEKPTNGDEPDKADSVEAELEVVEGIVPEPLTEVPESQRQAIENFKHAVLHPPEVDYD